MKSKGIIRIGTAMVSISLTGLLFGCVPETKSLENKAGAPANRGSMAVTEGRTSHYSAGQNDADTAPEQFEQLHQSAEARARELAGFVTNMEGISEAFVVVNGRTAIVGINLAREMTDTQLIDLKNVVKKEVMSRDKDITHVAVTASPELVERVNRLMGSGGPSPSEQRELEQNKDNDAFFRVAPTI